MADPIKDAVEALVGEVKAEVRAAPLLPAPVADARVARIVEAQHIALGTVALGVGFIAGLMFAGDNRAVAIGIAVYLVLAVAALGWLTWVRRG